MKTACPACRAPLTRREWLVESPALFVEVYACGAVWSWGQVEKDRPPIRSCAALEAAPPRTPERS